MSSPSLSSDDTITSPLRGTRDGTSRTISVSALAVAVLALVLVWAQRPSTVQAVGTDSAVSAPASVAVSPAQIAQQRWREVVALPTSALMAHYGVPCR